MGTTFPTRHRHKKLSKEGSLFERARNASVGIELVDSPDTRGKDRLRRDKDLKLDVAISPTLDPEFEGSGVTAIELLSLSPLTTEARSVVVPVVVTLPRGSSSR